MPLQVEVLNNAATLETEIFLYERLPEGKLAVVLPMHLVLQEKEIGQFSEPTLRLSYWFAQELFKALAEKLDRLGVKTDSDAKREGLLEATKYHLEDMRTLALQKTA